jgi:hypothetical protein
VPTPPTTEAMMHEAIAALKQEKSLSAAARKLGLSRSAFQDRIYKARNAGLIEAAPPEAPEVPQATPLPDPDLPIEQLVTYRKSAFERRHANVLAKRWRRFKVPTHGPYALMFVGDPHLDDDGCNLPLWEDHCELMAGTEHLYAVNIGDVTNDWVGRLAKLYANQEMGAHNAKRLVKHYLAERGIPWFLWLHGNHDMWDGPVGRDFFEGHRPNYVTMEDWQAKVTMVSPNGKEIRLWAAHNFKGNSIWNPMHGPLRAAQMEDWAHLYVAGHHHNCGLFQHENAHRDFVANGMRVRGYKFIDSYADLHQFGSHQYGASGIAIIDPDADKLNAVTCFLDPFEGVDYLKFKRRKLAA